MKRNPLSTSMWVRLPWRCLTGASALLTFTPEGLAFAVANMGWIIGDVATGSFEWKLADVAVLDDSNSHNNIDHENDQLVAHVDGHGRVNIKRLLDELDVGNGPISGRMAIQRPLSIRSLQISFTITATGPDSTLPTEADSFIKPTGLQCIQKVLKKRQRFISLPT